MNKYIYSDNLSRDKNITLIKIYNFSFKHYILRLYKNLFNKEFLKQLLKKQLLNIVLGLSFCLVFSYISFYFGFNLLFITGLVLLIKQYIGLNLNIIKPTELSGR